MSVETENLPLAPPFWNVVRPSLQAMAQTAWRVALAIPFFKSGLTKWDGFLQLSDSADTLFAEEFRLHLFGAEYSVSGAASRWLLLPAAWKFSCPSCWFSDWERGWRRWACSA